MFELANLKAGRWDEAEARAYVQLAQWAAQRLRSISAESVGAVYARSEERFGDSYLFTPGLFPAPGTPPHSARDEALGLPSKLLRSFRATA